MLQSLIELSSVISETDGRKERVYLPQNNKKTYKIILNISTVAGYQIGKPIKLVAYSANYIKSYYRMQQEKKKE